MMLTRVISIKNVGRFRNSAHTPNSPLAKYTLIYGANGYGKTTLCSVLRSIESGDTAPLVGRKTLGSTTAQEIDLLFVTSASYDLANRLTSRTVAGVTASPTWDTNGNLMSDGVRTYTWDARNRLSGIGGVASFGYDSFNRRQTATRSGVATSFLYDGWDVAQEQQGGSPSADLLLGLGADERFTRGGSTFVTDALGSTVALASSGAVQTSYGYDAYGVTQVTGTASTSTFQFAGRENDNTGLYNYRNRYYNPAWGRFISEDPVGLNGGDINLYRYVFNNPINQRDPLGLWTMQIGFTFGGTAGVAAGSLFGGVAIDSNGGAGLYYGYGAGLGVGGGASLGASGATSTANYITDLAGPFANVSGGGGWGPDAQADAFYGSNSRGENIVGGGLTIGAGVGASGSALVTNTSIVRFW